MSTFVNNDVSPNNIIYASDHNTQGALLAAVINGGIDNANIASGAAIDGSKLGDSTVTTAKVIDGAITSNKLSLGAQTALVTTGETTISTSYTDLATTTDTVTTTIGANGLALVIITADLFTTTAGAYSFVGFAASGANTIAVADARALKNKTGSGSEEFGGSWTYLATGLTPGSTVFKLKYRVTAGTGNFQNRRIAVIPF